MNPATMTVEQLKELQRLLFYQAGEDGTLRLLALVARELGTPLQAKYGPKYRWQSGAVAIYRDDYGGYTTVEVEGKLVCSTHPCTSLFVPGQWLEEVKAAAVIAGATEESKRRAVENRERLELLDRLGLQLEPPDCSDVFEE